MNISKTLLITIAATCVALLGIALYLQLGEGMLPCPLCVAQRYVFVAIAVICIILLILPVAARKVGSWIGAVIALIGAGIALRHLWVKAHPALSCGIDPWEVALNKIFTAELVPVLFKADGMCSTEYEPILGLSIPQWSLVWFAIFALSFVVIAMINKRPNERNVFGRSR
ncbi:disulfide bond formation protein B [Undibacterium terreum]|uniref:Disulfide bond formation protein B n=1 Tax=Undibacterium terreum TaxID=1224302 RepID=A0A916UVB9_9BURK|nr:disulfide bond formation protein B [Undibacterium terreum]GGC89660.1 disulfide bond formation protein B 1 [Undibacterium terreum]